MSKLNGNNTLESCYIFSCYQDLVDSGLLTDKNRIDKEFIYTDKQGNKKTTIFSFIISEKKYNGWIIKSIDTRELMYPAKDTWDGWIPIENNYIVFSDFEERTEDKLLLQAMLTKKELVKWIDEDFPKIVEEYFLIGDKNE